MTEMERREKERQTQYLSQLIRARLMAEVVGAVVVFQDFKTGVALFHFAPETLQKYDLSDIVLGGGG